MAKRAHRDYQNSYPSVTTVLGVLRKIGLENWFKCNTIKFINAETKKGKEAGTDIHKAIEYYILTGEAKIETNYPEEVTNALKSFMLFRKENPEIKLKWSEMPLVSNKYGFNGTIDCIGFIGDRKILLDWKGSTSKEKEKPEIYDEYRYQVSAYVILYNENNPEEPIRDAIIVPVSKDKIAYNKYEMNCSEITDCFSEVFLPALRILNFQRTKKVYA